MTEELQRHVELLAVADTVARDKGIEREQVLEAMEQAIQKAGRSKPIDRVIQPSDRDPVC